MNILQISSTDLIGQRFNGHYLTRYFREMGYSAKQLVWRKEGDSNFVELGFNIPKKFFIQKVENRVEHILSTRGVLHPSSWLVAREPAYREADIVHFQLMQWPNFFSFQALPYLTRNKTAFFTVHDLWPATGHCVSAYGCDRWQIGCGECPELGIDFAIKRDTTRANWRLKKYAFDRSRLNLVVASDLMVNRLKKSPILNQFPIFKIPFGLDSKVFSTGDKRLARLKLGISEDAYVISFRAARDPVKGLKYIQSALRDLNLNKKVVLLTFNDPGLMKDFEGRFVIKDLGWVNDESLLVDSYRASDLFLMPSVQETFGMMCLEAISCGCPVVGFDETAVPELIQHTGCGEVVPQGNSQALAMAIRDLLLSPEKREAMRVSGAKVVSEFYDIRKVCEMHLKVYKTQREMKIEQAEHI